MITYLSGAMEQAADEGAGWRKEMTFWLREQLNHNVIDPVISSEKLVEENDAFEYRNWKDSDPNRFIGFVRKAIDLDLDNVMNKSDYLICLWNKDVLKGGGTHGELTMAYYVKKPIYMVNKIPNEDLSGWIMSCATEIFSDFDELKMFLISKYSKII